MHREKRREKSARYDTIAALLSSSRRERAAR
jgi:hypothetical protein